MHTFSGKSCTIHHNSDLSGHLIVSPTAAGNVAMRAAEGQLTSDSLYIDAKDLFDFVAEQIRASRIGKLENASTEDILGFKWSDL